MPRAMPRCSCLLALAHARSRGNIYTDRMLTEENFREKSRPRHPICVEKREEITIDKETDSLCVVARPPLPPRRVASPHAPSPGRVPPGVPHTTTRSVGSRRVRVYGRPASAPVSSSRLVIVPSLTDHIHPTPSPTVRRSIHAHTPRLFPRPRLALLRIYIRKVPGRRQRRAQGASEEGDGGEEGAVVVLARGCGGGRLGAAVAARRAPRSPPSGDERDRSGDGREVTPPSGRAAHN